MNFFIVKILGKYFTSDQWANFIVKETAGLAGRVFNNDQFQDLAKVKKLDQEEQNRIFNEVQVTGMVYSMLFIEQKRKYLDENRALFWREVVQKIPDTFYGWLSELKIERQYIDIWRKLIDLRLEEYKEGRFELKHVLEGELKDDNSPEDIKDLFYCLEATAIGSILHITRGKVEPGNFLKKHMMTWLGILQADLAKKVN